MTLPAAFTERMRRLLGEEYDAFAAAEAQPPVRALRLNRLKMSPETFAASGLADRPLPQCEGAYYCDASLRLGAHPYHHAGAIYGQDPGAICTAAAVSVQAGWRILDVCAAPGGKATQLADALGGTGLLIANEPNAARCRTLAQNIERMGVRNACVTSAAAAALAACFPGYFDLTVVDAPCSGEGMFRKYPEAIGEWSEAAVQSCAARQREILVAACATVRGGGYLLYSTCTFSPEENEEVVRDFLLAHPDFSLVPVARAVAAVTADGLYGMTDCRRFYPHLAPGEGQFIALMRRSGDASREEQVAFCDATEPLPRAAAEAARAFFCEATTLDPTALRLWRGSIVMPPPCPVPPRITCAAGVAAGELRGRLFFPHHALFSAFGRDFRRRIELTREDPRTRAYLRGEVIAAPGLPNGWAAVLIDGAPVGGAKVVDGAAKNHYPKGLRLLGQ